jgi:hypothetical protein
MQAGNRRLSTLEMRDGPQHLRIGYGEDGKVAEMCHDDGIPGRLPELARLLAKAADGFAASVAFVAGLGDEGWGPGRVHYPVPVPGGVFGVWRTGLKGCRRALYEERVDAAARFIVADGLDGRAVGSGATLEEARAQYDAEVARSLPEQRRTVETSTDDYDDDGNLLARGELPPGFEDVPPSDASAGVLPAPEDPEERDDHEAWRGGTAPSFPVPETDPVTGRIDLTGGPITIRGPTSDASPVPRRPECVPHVILPLDPSPDESPTRGRWVRLLGELGTTRHAVRIEERDGFVLVGADLLGLVDLKDLRSRLDALEREQDSALRMSSSGDDRFLRYRAREYRWRPEQGDRPEGLVFASGSAGPRFEPGSLDGDALQARVRRHRRILRRP